MSLDATLFKYTEDQEWRVLTAVEMGQRNHELVATELIHNIAGMRGTVHHILGDLLRSRLVSHEGKPYDGYQLTKTGYDFLALHALVKRGTISHLGPLIGQGKEADVYVAYNTEDKPVIIKFHRIGRVSFRKAKDTRDYLSNKHTSSWLYLSRLSAKREFQNMKGLHSRGFPVPEAIDYNRHCIVMSHIEGSLLNNINEMNDPLHIFNELIDVAVNMLKIGVVHADFTQFNVIVAEDNSVTLIDFPQCLKSDDPEAEDKFNHDLNELRKFFNLRFDLKVEEIPTFADFRDEIVPVDIIGHDSTEEEEEDNPDEDVKIIKKVGKENRLRRKPKKAKETKTMTKLRLEVKHFE